MFSGGEGTQPAVPYRQVLVTGAGVITIHYVPVNATVSGWVELVVEDVTYTSSAEVVLPEPGELVAIPPWPWPVWPEGPARCEGPRPRARRVGCRLAPARRRTATGVRNWRARR